MEPLPDIDPQETQEWLEALESVLTQGGSDRAHYLLERLVEKARRSGAYLPYSATTAYINTIPPGKEDRSPGNYELEHRIRSYVRWNSKHHRHRVPPYVAPYPVLRTVELDGDGASSQ